MLRLLCFLIQCLACTSPGRAKAMGIRVWGFPAAKRAKERSLVKKLAKKPAGRKLYAKVQYVMNKWAFPKPRASRVPVSRTIENIFLASDEALVLMLIADAILEGKAATK